MDGAWVSSSAIAEFVSAKWGEEQTKPQTSITPKLIKIPFKISPPSVDTNLTEILHSTPELIF